MNQGKADFENKQNLINFNIKENEADIVLVTKANNKFTDTSKVAIMQKTFKGFRIEESKQDKNYKIRCIMLIKNKIQYQSYIKGKGICSNLSNTKTEYIQAKMSTQPKFCHSQETIIHKLITKQYETVSFNYIAFH